MLCAVIGRLAPWMPHAYEIGINSPILQRQIVCGAVLGVSIPDGMGGSAKFCSALHDIVLSSYPDRTVACTAQVEVTQIRQLRKD